MSQALAVTYHAVEPGPPPLFIDPALFRDQLDQLCDIGVVSLTVTELASAMRDGPMPPRSVALTFDDAFASVIEIAAPLMAERNLRGTVFAIAGRLGATNRWPTQPSWVPERRLAAASQLREVSDAGWEIGSHGWDHIPLQRADETVTRRELVESRSALEQEIGCCVRAYAAPYGIAPRGSAGRILREKYLAACSGGPALVGVGADPFAIPRVDVHYLRRPRLLVGVAGGGLRSYVR